MDSPGTVHMTNEIGLQWNTNKTSKDLALLPLAQGFGTEDLPHL